MKACARCYGRHETKSVYCHRCQTALRVEESPFRPDVDSFQVGDLAKSNPVLNDYITTARYDRSWVNDGRFTE